MPDATGEREGSGADARPAAKPGGDSGHATRGEARSADPGGFRSQSPWLKAMLVVSLAFIVFGVYRCSVEMTPSDEPGVIRVERATVSVPEERLAVPPDSLAALATRLYAGALAEASTAEVAVGEHPEAWAVVRLNVFPAGEGQVELICSAVSTVSGGRLAVVSVKNDPVMLREMTHEAAVRMAEMLSLAATQGTEDP